MSLIAILSLRCGKRESVRSLLSGFGVSQWRTFATPLSSLSVTEVIALLYNWILREIDRDEVVTFLILADETDEAYQLSLASRKGGLYVERIRKRPDLKNKLLYYWGPDTTFGTLTRAKIEQSLRTAEFLNQTQGQPSQLPLQELKVTTVKRSYNENQAIPQIIAKTENSKD